MKKSTLHNLFARTAPVAILLFASALASADTILLVLSSTTITVGDTFTLDLIASNLQLGGYDVTFHYNPLLASIDNSQVLFDTHLGAPDNSFSMTFADLDTLELAEVSFLTSAADLAALQTDSSYPLAHIPVKALLPGTLSLDFASTPFTSVTDYAGVPVSSVTYESAVVTILDATQPPLPPTPTETPEPGSVVLLVTGVALMAGGRLGSRRRSRVRS